MSDKQIDDGGPVFPVPTSVELNENSNRRMLGDIESCGGMSVRDWFAGMALQCRGKEWGQDGYSYDKIAEYCYQQADAMLKERLKS